MAQKKGQATDAEELAGLLDGYLPPEDTPRLPGIQIHGKLEHEYTAAVGAFEVPTKVFTPEVIANLPTDVVLAATGEVVPASVRKVRHGKKTEVSWVSRAIHLVFIARGPTTYERKLGGQVVPATQDEFGEKGVYSREHFLVVWHEGWQAGYHGLMQFSIKSTAVGHMNRVTNRKREGTLDLFIAEANPVLTAHYQSALRAAGREEEAAQLRINLPHYAYVVGLAMQDHQDTEEGGVIVPFVADLPPKVTAEAVLPLLTAPDIRDFIQEEENLEYAQAFRQGFVDESFGDDNGYDEATGRRGGARRGRREGSTRPTSRAGTTSGRGDLNITVNLSPQDVPDDMQGFVGQTFAAILAAGGAAFVEFLANDYEPRNAGEHKLTEAAQRVLDA